MGTGKVSFFILLFLPFEKILNFRSYPCWLDKIKKTFDKHEFHCLKNTTLNIKNLKVWLCSFWVNSFVIRTQLFCDTQGQFYIHSYLQTQLLCKVQKKTKLSKASPESLTPIFQEQSDVNKISYHVRSKKGTK